MADQQTDLAIVIEAVNKASAQLKQVEKDLGGLSKAVGEQGKEAQTASVGFGTLVAGVATGTVVAGIAMQAFQKLSQIVTELPGKIFEMAKTASEIEGVGIAMHIVANNAGITADAVDKVRDSVVEQNVTTAAANRLLTDLIRNQVDYTQATKLASAAQNIAVASGVSSSETIERISSSISSGNTWLLRELGLVEHLDGVYEKYGATLNKTSEEMTEAERKQAVINYVLSEGEKYTGAYEAAMRNAGKIMRSTQDRVKEISYSFGKVFEPALYEATKVLYDFVNSVVKWAQANEGKLNAIASSIGNFVKEIISAIKGFIQSLPMDMMAEAFNSVVRGIAGYVEGLRVAFNITQIFVNFLDAGIATVVEFGKAMLALVNRDFEGLSKGFTEYIGHIDDVRNQVGGNLEDIGKAWSANLDMQQFDIETWWKNIQAIEGNGWDDRLKTADVLGTQLTAKQKEKLKKMTEDITKENKEYTKQVAKRAKDFAESFDDLVMTHRDKIKELTEDLKKENADYQKSVQDLEKDFNLAMKEIEASHKEKSASIMQDMEDERKKANEEIEAITEKYNEENTLIVREGEARLGDLKSQLEREKALGDFANKDKIAALEQMIAYEQNGLDVSLEEKKAKYDEEVSDVNEALDEKLEKLKTALANEDQVYTESLAKRKDQYAEDVQSAKESYEEKRLSLQTELDTETAIRQKYADDFKRIGDKMAEDDLTRLKRKYEEEKAEAESEHQQKLIDIKQKAFDEGLGMVEGLASGFESGYPVFKSKLDQMGNDIDSVVSKSISLLNNNGSGGSFTNPGGGGNGGGGGNAWAEGGLVTSPGIVGEAGPEVVLPLNFPKRMAQIMQAMGLGGGGGGQVTQNFYVTVQNSQDVDVLMERAGFAYKHSGGLS